MSVCFSLVESFHARKTKGHLETLGNPHLLKIWVFVFIQKDFLFGSKFKSTQIILLSSTAESSATSGYVVVTERFGQNEERASRNEEQAIKSLVLTPVVEIIDAVCKHR